MLFLAHKPAPALARFIDHLWCLQDAPVHAREHVLPTGTLELVINLAEDEFRVYDRDHPERCQRFAGAMVSGAYSRYFVIDTREHSAIMGVHFRPGGALPFLGVPPGTLADTHVELSQLWGARASELREQLCGTCSSERRFELLERALLKRMADASPRPASCAGIAMLGAGQKVGEVAKELSLSRRRLISVFSADVGTTPKLFARIQRFQRTLERMHRSEQPDWSQLALASGYFDQSHMIRDFVDFAGVAPAALRSRGQQNVKADHIAAAPGSHLSNTPAARGPTLSQKRRHS